MDARGITVALGGRWQGQYGLCRCPAHADKTPSLKVKDDEGKSDGVDVHCFAGCRWDDVKAELVRRRLLPEFTPGNNRPTLTARLPEDLVIGDHEDDARKLKRAKLIWRTAVPLPGTLGFKYFTQRRGLHIGALGALDHALRWHDDIAAVVALMTDPFSNEPTGVHRTFLNSDGTKRERKMLGRQGVVRLSPDEYVTLGLGIAEGIEDGLAVLLSGWAPVWAATSAGAIKRFPALPGIEYLTIFADSDEVGMSAAQTCVERWVAADREARTVSVKDGAP